MKNSILIKTTFSSLLLLSISCTGSMWNSGKNTKIDLTRENTAESFANVEAKESPVRGWEHTIKILNKSGLSKDYLENVYSSNKMPYWTPISFKVKPKESSRMYQELANEAAAKNASQFMKDNYLYFMEAEKKFSVPKEVIGGILQVETQCGKNTGNEYIIYWLSRLVSAGFDLNIDYNLRTSKEEPQPTTKELEERANWLLEEFLPHLVSVLKHSEENGSDPFEVKGSKGGAIGMAQFLPKNVELFGLDGDKNGSINLHTPADAIYSVANFLSKHGWVTDLAEEKKEEVILEYNRSTSYAKTVILLSKKLKTK